MNKYANIYLTKVAETLNLVPHLPLNQDRGPLNGWGSDLFVLPESLRRAGGISALQDAIGAGNGQRSVLNRYPTSTGIGYSALGSLLGGGAGAGLGSLIGALASESENRGAGASAGALIGGGIGTVSGGVAGLILNLIKRRRAQDEVIRDYPGMIEAYDKDKIQPGNILASLRSGMHQSGRADVKELLSRKPMADRDMPRDLMTIAAAGRSLGAPIAAPLETLGNVALFLDAKKRIQKA